MCCDFRLLGPLLGLTLALALSGPGRADETYRWVDKDGVVHFTDNPMELPEPQRSQVLRKLEAERARQKAAREANPGAYEPIPPEAREERIPPQPPPQSTPAPTPEPPPADPADAQTEKPGREQWQARLKAARERVEELERLCVEITEQQQSANQQFLMFGRPGAQAEAAQALEA
jgi:hypothetical protein